MKWLWVVLLAGCGRAGFDEVVSDRTGYWRLDDGNGTTGNDASGHGHPISLVGDVRWTSGEVAGGIAADGTNGFLVVPVLDFTATDAITLAAWVKRAYTDGPEHTLFELSTDYNKVTTGFGFFPDDITVCAGGKVMLGVHGNVGYSIHCYTQPSSGEWHHLVAVYDRSQPGDAETAFYVDGAVQTPLATPYSDDNTDQFGAEPFYVFSRAGTSEYDTGIADEIELYPRALTSGEIAGM